MPPHDDSMNGPELTQEEYLRMQQHVACEAMADAIVFALDLKRYEVTTSLLAPALTEWLRRQLFPGDGIQP